MNTLPETILLQAESLPEGGVLSPKEFLHLGSRPAIDQALSRLTKAGKLLRVARGIYVAPVSSRFGTRAPAPEKVVKAMAEQSGEVVAPHGARAANALGLTQQVPIREVYLTSGKTRKLKSGHSEVLIKHAPRWMLALGTGQAGAAVRALAWMGPTHAGESLASLRRTLPRAEWSALASVRAALPILDGAGGRPGSRAWLITSSISVSMTSAKDWNTRVREPYAPPTCSKKTCAWYGPCAPCSTHPCPPT